MNCTQRKGHKEEHPGPTLGSKKMLNKIFKLKLIPENENENYRVIWPILVFLDSEESGMPNPIFNKHVEYLDQHMGAVYPSLYKQLQGAEHPFLHPIRHKKEGNICKYDTTCFGIQRQSHEQGYPGPKLNINIYENVMKTKKIEQPKIEFLKLINYYYWQNNCKVNFSANKFSNERHLAGWPNHEIGVPGGPNPPTNKKIILSSLEYDLLNKHDKCSDQQMGAVHPVLSGMDFKFMKVCTIILFSKSANILYETYEKCVL